MSDVSALLGRVVAGKYLLEAHVGGGAMGEVYRARHVVLEAPIAIKIMRGDIARDPAFRERFLREARATSRLEHPNSVRVVDFGEDPDGLVYLAMEFLAGRDLLAVLRDGFPLPDARIVDLLSQTLSAVSMAHAHGIVHRDLKPENIMVLSSHDDDGPRDVVKVCDFGIAKLIDPRALETDASGNPLTSHGAVVGTPEYMSPEQARGDALDTRSDIYSVGVILYQLLTGKLPFTGDSALGVVLKQVIDAPVPPSSVRPGVNPKLEAICLRALAKSPDARYATAKEMRSELRAAISGAAPSHPAPESDPALMRTLPVSWPVSGVPPVPGSGRTLPLGAPIASAQSARQLPSPPTSGPDLTSKPTVGGGPGLEVPVAKPRTAMLGLVAVSALAMGALSVVVFVATTNAKKEPTSVVPRAAETGRRATGAKREEEPREEHVRPVPPLPRGGTSALASPLAPGTATAGRNAVAARPDAGVAAPPASASAAVPVVASAAPSASAAAPYNPSGAFVGLGAVSAERVKPDAVTSLLRSASPAITECYQVALRIVGSPVGGRVELTLATDDQGRVTAAVANEPRLPSFGRCVQNALVGRKVEDGDAAGTATQWLELHP